MLTRVHDLLRDNGYYRFIYSFRISWGMMVSEGMLTYCTIVQCDLRHHLLLYLCGVLRLRAGRPRPMRIALSYPSIVAEGILFMEVKMWTGIVVNMSVIQIGSHVGLHIDFCLPDNESAIVFREALQIKAEAAKLLTTLGFDLSEVDLEWAEVNIGF